MPPRARENRGPGSIATTSSRRFLPPHDRLGIGIFEEAFEPALDANARLLHAAEGRRRGEMLGFVDPDGSARDALSDRERLVLVAAPDRAAEPIFACIGARYDLVAVVELNQRPDGANMRSLADAAVPGRHVKE